MYKKFDISACTKEEKVEYYKEKKRFNESMKDNWKRMNPNCNEDILFDMDKQGFGTIEANYDKYGFPISEVNYTVWSSKKTK